MSLCPVSLCRLKSQIILPNPQTYTSSGVRGHVLTGPFFTHQHPPSPNYALRQLCFLPQCGDSFSPLSPFFPPSATLAGEEEARGFIFPAEWPVCTAAFKPFQMFGCQQEHDYPISGMFRQAVLLSETLVQQPVKHY